MDTLQSVTQLLEKLGNWTLIGYRYTVDKATKSLADKYSENIRAGLDANGSPMAQLKLSTLSKPIRRGDSTLRSSYGFTPMSATGATANSLEATKVGGDEWQIASKTDLGDAILKSNAKTTHDGLPFGGDVQKVVRDPVTVEEKQMDLIENSLVEDLERLLL